MINLSKCRRYGRMSLARGLPLMPGQQGSKLATCAAISDHGVLSHIPVKGPYNTHLLTFLDTLYRVLIPNHADLPMYVVIWDNVSFHHSSNIRQEIETHYRMLIKFLTRLRTSTWCEGGRFMIVSYILKLPCWLPLM